MNLRQLKEHWDSFGKRDAFWAVLTDPSKRDGGWRAEEFFETGERDVEGMLEHARRLGFRPNQGRALDFGCGVGRLTQALARRFPSACGVDIAPSMIRLARKYNRHGRRCRYFLHDRADLGLFPAAGFDFICSLITLQHIGPEFSRHYIREFLRVLAPGGLLVFQLPSERKEAREESAGGCAAGPLPESAFRAEISVDASRRISMSAGSTGSVRARVKNTGDTVWPASCAPDGSFQINLGNHWLGERRGLLLRDDGRARLPADLRPSEEVALELKVTAPVKAGDYILELDLVQEGVAWFKDRGSATASLSVSVREGVARKLSGLYRAVAHRRRRTGDSLFFGPVMEMHGIPRDEVLKLLEECGARLLDVHEDGSAGNAWVSLRYFVTK